MNNEDITVFYNFSHYILGDMYRAFTFYEWVNSNSWKFILVAVKLPLHVKVNHDCFFFVYLLELYSLSSMFMIHFHMLRKMKHLISDSWKNVLTST